MRVVLCLAISALANTQPTVLFSDIKRATTATSGIHVISAAYNSREKMFYEDINAFTAIQMTRRIGKEPFERATNVAEARSDVTATTHVMPAWILVRNART
jgi:hypothetical protein